MIRKIIRAVFPKPAPHPPPVCVGQFSRGNQTAKLFKVFDSLGFHEVWISLHTYDPNSNEVKTLGVLRVGKLDDQVEALRQAAEFLASPRFR